MMLSTSPRRSRCRRAVLLAGKIVLVYHLIHCAIDVAQLIYVALG